MPGGRGVGTKPQAPIQLSLGAGADSAPAALARISATPKAKCRIFMSHSPYFVGQRRLSLVPVGRASGFRCGPETAKIHRPRTKTGLEGEKGLVFQMLPVDGRELPVTVYSQSWGSTRRRVPQGAGDDKIRTGCAAYRSLSAPVSPRCGAHRDHRAGFHQQGAG